MFESFVFQNEKLVGVELKISLNFDEQKWDSIDTNINQDIQGVL